MSHKRRYPKPKAPAKRRDHSLHCPSRKQGYKNEGTCKQAIVLLDKPYPLAPYRCPHCRYWHMTSKV